MKRVLDITEKFSGRAFVVINKSDLSPDMSDRIKKEASLRNVPVILNLPFSRNMVLAVTEKKIPSLAEKEFFQKAHWEGFIKTITQ
jgi:MinD superfamily P-loop ATPase